MKLQGEEGEHTGVLLSPQLLLLPHAPPTPPSALKAAAEADAQTRASLWGCSSCQGMDSTVGG